MSEEVKCPNCFYMRKGSGLILGGQCCNPDSKHCGKDIDKSKGCDKGEFWRPECVICRQTLHKELQIELKETGLKIDGDRILTDQQLRELHNDIRDGKTVLVSTEYRDRFEAAVRKLLSYLPDNLTEEIDGVGALIPVKYINEVKRLLGPEPKEPPKET